MQRELNWVVGDYVASTHPTLSYHQKLYNLACYIDVVTRYTKDPSGNTRGVVLMCEETGETGDVRQR